MKFLETLCFHLVNVDHISHITYESSDSYARNPDQYYSYIHLKSGEKFDFIDLPATFVKEVDGEKQEVKFDGDYVYLLNRFALNLILTTDKPVIYNEELEEQAWEMFAEDQRMKNLVKQGLI